MPELPEVETVRRQLREKVVGKTVAKVRVYHPKPVMGNKNFSKQLKGKTIADINRVGKLIIFSFVSEVDLYMLAHLKMTGQFFYIDKTGATTGGGHTLSEQKVTVWPHKHTRVAFHFSDESSLYFNDQRLFGYTKLATADEVVMVKKKFGPEPHAVDFNEEWFIENVKKRKAFIKAVLLDQSFVAGLGNIYVDEALWRAKVKPTRRANTLTKAEAQRLATVAKEVLQESIAVGGTTFQHFVDTGGRHGNFRDYLQVFGKQGLPCSRCGTEITKKKVAGRGTHFCAGCQK